MAVAIKHSGFKNIKIYNGGLKDWERSGHKIQTIEKLPDFLDYKKKFLSHEELLKIIEAAEKTSCMDKNGDPLLTILDYRIENFFNPGTPLQCIKTECRTIKCFLDDLRKEKIRADLPEHGIVIVISETGNRDWAVIRYLHKYGHKNIFGLKFGMRGWIKANYPVKNQ